MASLLENPVVAEIIGTSAILRPPQWRYMLTQHAVADPHATLDFLKPIDRMAYVACVVRRADKWAKLGLPQKSKVRVDSKERQLIMQAFKLYEQNGIRAMRFLLEAMLLTGAGVPAVAAKLLLPKELIGVFHNMFFDVTRYLADPDLVYTYVLPSSFSRARMGAVWDICWKVIALRHGLEALMRVVQGKPTQTEQATLFESQQARLNEMSCCVLHADPGSLDERHVAILDATRKHKKLGLDSKMQVADSRVAAMGTFFDELAIVVDCTLKKAVPLPGKTSAKPAEQNEVLLLPDYP